MDKKLKIIKLLTYWLMPAIIVVLLGVIAFVRPAPIVPGVLSGHVTIGPICPVERIGHPCLPSPEAYAAREIVVYRTDGKTIVASTHPSATGAYQFSLRPGRYVIGLAKSGIDHSKDLPREITIESGKILTLDIDIDTGIR